MDYGSYGVSGGYDDYTSGNNSSNLYGGGGGGFNATNDGGGGYSSQESGSAREGKGKTNDHSVTPLTIKMILEAPQEPDDNFIIDGKTLTKICVVGFVKDKKEKATSMTLLLDDGTGMIEVTLWIGSEENQIQKNHRDTIQQGLYVRVNGLLKSFNEKKTITAHDIRLLPTHNAFTEHMLSTVFTHLNNTKGPCNRSLDPENLRMQREQQSFGGNNSSFTNNSSSNSSGMIHNSSYNSGASPMQGGGFGNSNNMAMMGGGSNYASGFNHQGGAPYGGGSPVAQQMQQQRGGMMMNNNNIGGGNNLNIPSGVPGLSKQHLLVLNAIRDDGKRDEGNSLTEIFRRLQGQYSLSMQDVKRATEYLTQEGHIYSTIDDNHFKSTDGG